ncbi:uncharacterized protein LOC119384024 [Rhipicephalus sanguineus]|uniref:uncharacterized protein LOC119384024 n=1 Tax=Rhipicephalus sanguineus TaxID=34632 RepID=UPI001894532B|nr:uncharacterized protein LOC119384024 [Rhipicephalus sanguineus]
MNVVLALTLVAVLGVVSGTQFTLCQAPAERRHELVNCVKSHVNDQTSQKLTEVKQRLNCEDLDCVFTKICELNPDAHQQHSNAFLPDDVKADVRAALVQCRPSD